MINIKSNKKKLLIISIIVLILIIWIVGYIISNKEKPTEEIVLSPMPSPTSAPYIPPQSSKIDVNGVEVNNFYKNALMTQDDGYALFDQTTRYKIAYIPVDDSFLISITDNPFETIRKEAEAAFILKLGITKEEACRLKVNISTNIRINPSYAGQNFPLSFCN